MARTLTIGGLDTAALALHEGAGLPLLDAEALGHHWVTDCLAQAVQERKGVIVLAPRGAGKTVAAQRDLARFEAAEHARREREATYIPRRVVALTTLRVASVRTLYIALYKAAFDVPPVERVYRRPKQDEELRDELIARCEEERVVAFVIDEAQTLTAPAFEALRDLMAVAETSARSRIERAPDGRELVRPAGVGVLLLATLELQPSLFALPEYGRRWIRTEVIGALEEPEVPGILRQLLPAFEAGARALGDEAWAATVQRLLSRGRRVAVAVLHDVARRYVCRAGAEQPDARSVRDLPWDEELFRQAIFENVGLQILGQEAA